MHVQTVSGPVDPARLGRVLSHEHLLSLSARPGLGPDPADLEGAFAEHQISLAVSALRGVRAYGVDTLVDLSPYGDAGRDPIGANVVLLPEISRRAEVRVVCGTASYREACPDWVRAASLAS